MSLVGAALGTIVLGAFAAAISWLFVKIVQEADDL